MEYKHNIKPGLAMAGKEAQYGPSFTALKKAHSLRLQAQIVTCN